ncbi:hypothetical protein CTAM01_13149 [Colletotrichum tamarilloi]|uniref:Uncharacterized protein n=1 Tax=Colletotrichum tamarilloi TaxID=1209934 RepID=A0ABQ9QSZ8_9PEZI|nr:uncharacterized protein CTAM01_13149 [Colletotrichum tamarilloi]KAK1484043.1 hypothetical protein CTAM01_13149 [Colletotrichum tamarilloi]
MDLRDLPSIDSLDGEKRVAWLIEGQLVDGVINFRDCLGSLTARRLAEALSKPRYRNTTTINRQEQDNAREMNLDKETPAFDAERRLL